MSSGNKVENNEEISEELEVVIEDESDISVTDTETIEPEFSNDEELEVQTEESEEEPEPESEVEPPTYEELQSENEELKVQVDGLSGRLRSVSAAFHKKSEEVSDTKKRLERQSEFNKTRLRGDVVSSMFAPFENLKRSIEACEKGDVDEAMISGLLMVKDEFWSSLKNLGLEEIPGVGSLFNPNIHEVLTSIPVEDPVLNDTIIQVYSTGYRINDIVVNTAQVIIGKYYAPPKEEVSEEVIVDVDSSEEVEIPTEDSEE